MVLSKRIVLLLLGLTPMRITAAENSLFKIFRPKHLYSLSSSFRSRLLVTKIFQLRNDAFTASDFSLT